MSLLRRILVLLTVLALPALLTACAVPIGVSGYSADYSMVLTGEGIGDINGSNYNVTLEPSGVTCTGHGGPAGILQGRDDWTCSDGRTATITTHAMDPFGSLWRGEGSFSDGQTVVMYIGMDQAGVQRHLDEARQRQVASGGRAPGTTTAQAVHQAPSPYLQLTIAMVPQTAQSQSSQAALGGKVQLRDFLSRQFKTVREVDSLSTAQMTGSDLVAMYDVITDYSIGLADTATATVSVDIMTTDGRLIERLNGRGRDDGFVADVGTAVRKALGQVQQAFQRSAALRQTAETLVAEGPSEPQTPTPTRTARSAPTQTASKFPTKPVSLSITPAAPRPDDVAVIIGNADYGKLGKDIPDVVPAYADAESFKQFAIKVLGLREGNIIDLRDATGAQFTRVFGSDRNHQGQLYDWVRPDRSRVYVYYAGHGAPGGKDGGAFLVPADADATRIDLNGYPLKTLYANLAKIPAKSTTVIVEACFSGASEGGAVISNASPIYLKAKTPDVPKGLTVISAGGPNEMASWEEDRSNSLFTKYYVTGMAGAADKKPYGNGDGRVTLTELDSYLKDTVTYYARRYYGRDQTAVILSGN